MPTSSRHCFANSESMSTEDSLIPFRDLYIFHLEIYISSFILKINIKIDNIYFLSFQNEYKETQKDTFASIFSHDNIFVISIDKTN